MNTHNLEIIPFIEEDKIKKKITELAKAIDQQIKNYSEPAVALCVLKGSFLFFADLVREIQSDIKCDFLGCSSYGSGKQSSGEVQMTLDLSTTISGKNIILIEDIVDTGLTMNFLVDSIKARRPESITTVSLLDKPSERKNDFKVDLVGFEIPNEFVVGYGLDYDEKFRQLPYIAKVKNHSMN